MLNSIYSFSNEIFLLSRELIFPSLIDQHRRILLIVSAAFGLLATCYLAIRCYNRFQRSAIEVDKQTDSVKKIDKQAAPIKQDKQEEPAKKIDKQVDLIERDTQADSGEKIDEQADPIERNTQTADPTEKLDEQADPIEQDIQADPFDSEIIEKLESIELLDKFSPNLSPEQRFQLALQCGKELARLDLSHFKSLDDEKLNLLQQTCPNLRSLNLSHTPIETLNLSSLHSFSRLEKLDLSHTMIETL